MVTTRKIMCPESRYYLKCPFTRAPLFYVVHNTGNDAPAENEVGYMITRPEQVSFHLAIDDKEIIQGLPFDRNAWASGDGHGTGNMYGIHIEICYSKSGGSRFTKAEKNAAEYIAAGLKSRGWGIEHVKKHQDFDGKYCPHRTLDMGWQRFLDLIKKYMNKEVDEMTYEEFKAHMTRYEKEKAAKAASSWAEPALAYVKEKGIMVGDDTGMHAQSNITRQEVAQVIYKAFGGNKER